MTYIKLKYSGGRKGWNLAARTLNLHTSVYRYYAVHFVRASQDRV